MTGGWDWGVTADARSSGWSQPGVSGLQLLREGGSVVPASGTVVCGVGVPSPDAWGDALLPEPQ